MTSPESSNPVVHRLVAAINDGDRDAFLATLTPDATLTDDGNPRSPRRRSAEGAPGRPGWAAHPVNWWRQTRSRYVCAGT